MFSLTNIFGGKMKNPKYIPVILSLIVFVFLFASCKPTEKPKDYLKGLDVSHYQGTVRWDILSKNGLAFAFTKATGGIDFVDPKFHVNWQSMREEEIIRGAYHFFHPTDDPVKQAEFYTSTIGELLNLDLPPVVDVELAENQHADTIVTRLRTFLELIEKKLGRKPIIYSFPHFADRYLNDPRLGSYPLWIADYGADNAYLPPAWKDSTWHFWQYSDTGKEKGIIGDVDLNYFNGNLEGLVAFIEKSKKM